MIRTLTLLALCLALSGCELMAQAMFIHEWACQGEKSERCK